jgi:hypothetical protein
MKVYNVMSMIRIDYDFSALTYQEGCYFKKEDAIKRKEEVIKKFKNDYAEEIEMYGNKEMYPEIGEGALYIEDEDVYFEMSFGREEDQVIHQVWIDELEVK